MERAKTQRITIKNQQEFFKKALRYADKKGKFLATRSFQKDYPLGGFEDHLFIGSRKEFISFPTEDFFSEIKRKESGDYLVGYLSYDLKNQIEELQSNNPDHIRAPEGVMFVPETVLSFFDGSINLQSQIDPKDVLSDIENVEEPDPGSEIPSVEFEGAFEKEEYLDTIQKIREHIQIGDIYELNLSQNFSAQVPGFDYIHAFEQLGKTNLAPFASLFRFEDLVMIGSSPERFAKRQGMDIWSQPMKGTRPRGSTEIQDKELKEELSQSEKDIAENMMIMDLVRNDLAKSCKTGSVTVEEMFKVYPFEKVFQMITTVKGSLKENISSIEILRNAFPMGSMTGAPKIKAMELIEKYENRKRGLYSGAMGYMLPNGDFDFAVNIRSLVHKISEGLLSYHVGGAITWDSDPEEEYQESLWKAEHFKELFSN